eukprot:1151616-Pelagomonas_calceolata.AAC.8
MKAGVPAQALRVDRQELSNLVFASPRSATRARFCRCRQQTIPDKLLDVKNLSMDSFRIPSCMQGCS